MSDNQIPELRLPGDAAAAVQTAPAAEPVASAPSLMLDNLTEEEKKAVTDFVARIDVHDAQTVLGYGNEAQEQISQFSDRVLENVRTKDTGEVSDMLAQLVAELKGFDANEE